MELGLENKVAIVTGGSKGIGRFIVEGLKREGVDVYSISRSGNLSIQNNLYADLSKDIGLDIAKRYIRQIRPHILINNVGGVGRRPDNRFENYQEAYNMNVRTMLELTDEFIKHNPERCITISSIYGKESGLNPWFTMAKAAQIAYTKEMARRYRNTNTTFNTICPGVIDTGKLDDIYQRKSIGHPEDVANLVIFLCSYRARHINGANIVVDGGDSFSF